MKANLLAVAKACAGLAMLANSDGKWLVAADLACMGMDARSRAQWHF